jgi:hypothetical protein
MRLPGRSVVPTSTLEAKEALMGPGPTIGLHPKWIVVVLALAATGATAAERLVRSGLGVQLNPLGLRAEVEASWKWRLFRSTNPILKDAHVAVGIADQASPAYDRLQAWLELSPLSILDLRAGAEGVGYFGSFGNLVGFPSYDSDFSDDARKVLSEQAVARVGRRLYVSPILKFRLGRVSFRAAADFESWRVQDAPGAFFYEPFRGTLLDAGGDSLVSGSTLLLCDVSRSRSDRVRIGVFHDYLNVWGAPQNRKQRLGPLGLIKLGERRFAGRDPVLSVGVLDYLEAPNRSGVGGFVAMSMSLSGKPRP